MNSKAKLFYDINEPFAAGFFEVETDSPALKFCRAYRRYLEMAPLPEYKREDSLYPYQNLWCADYAVNPQYCRQFAVNYDVLTKKSSEAGV